MSKLALIGPLIIFSIQGYSQTLGQEPVVAIQQLIITDFGKVKLGEKLFSDPKLSKNNTVSCASCHNLNSGGADNKAKSIGINGSAGGINTPTVFNSGFNFVQFWNGRAKTLEDQIDGPVQHPNEMGSNWSEIVKKLKAEKNYVALFNKSYADGITIKNIKNAIALFEKQLTTPNSSFDKFLAGEKKAITPQQYEGYKKFKSYGCIACHQGMNIGGNMYQTMGIMGNYFQDRGTPITDEDLGRFKVTQKEQDRHVFRVPSLRNVALTAPYFHDGSAPDLETAVNVMAKYQLGRRLSNEDNRLIVDFLKTLTGENPKILERVPASKVGP